MKICPVGVELMCGQIDMMEVIGTFNKYGDASKMVLH
jgi:hypothetical protein